MEVIAYFLGTVVGLCFDVGAILFGLIVGMVARRWSHVLAIAMLAGIVLRSLVLVLEAGEGLEAEPFVGSPLFAGAAACLIWASAVFALRERKRRKRMSREVNASGQL
jgi:hypothetical protein